ncbi:uncharacterized protein LOC127858385 isoform X5 [Dreissena polymorpha]|uniref:uncharacterized protein LOC127858385 isoform X5 n=1 Tax=Dreissena polymorpha TaxID=45954 RepID=UPI002263AF4B|nr:uncharacterized protein LOC127858385 isoform X5 [Dreissena polymorpha]
MGMAFDTSGLGDTTTNLSADQSFIKLSEDGGTKFQCPWCGKTFTRRLHLDNHVNSHTGNRPYKCDMCNKRFTQKSHLTTHKVTHLNKDTFMLDIK